MFCDTRPRWADVQDTPPSQDVQASPPAAERLLCSQPSRCSQPSQESVDLDGTREALRAQLECSACLSATPPSLPSDEQVVLNVESSRCLRRMDSVLVPPGLLPTVEIVPIGVPPDAVLSCPQQQQDLLTPPRVPSHKRSHPKHAGEPKPGTLTLETFFNKRPRNTAPDLALSSPRRPSACKAMLPTPTRGTRGAPTTRGTPTRTTPSRQQVARSKLGVSEQDLERRREHRRNGVVAVKRSAGYQALKKIQAEDFSVAAPQTPDPDDLSISKRAWEKEVQDWRDALRKGCSGGNEEPIEEF